MLCNHCGINSPAEANFCIRCGADLNRTAAVRRAGAAPAGSGFREWGPGDILGNRYKILEKCGAGGMGIVYKAYDLVLEMIVAIKALHPILIEDERAIADMHREARMAMSLAHSNVVRIYTFDDREKILVMEYVEGQALDKRLSRPPGARLSLDEATYYVKQICEGLHCAYLAGVVHCDIKPANLLITDTKGLKIADFGIARVAKDSMTRRFTIKTIAGTPHYMSPEQWRSVKNLDIRTDIYSVGVIFYQMLTGQVPYPGDSSFSIGLKHINDPVPDPRAEVPDLPEWVTDFIAKAMAKRPEDRYQTPQAMLEAIPGTVQTRSSIRSLVQPIRREAGEKPKAPTLLLSTRRRVPVWMALTLAVVAVTLAGTVYKHYQRRAAKPPAETAGPLAKANPTEAAPPKEDLTVNGTPPAAAADLYSTAPDHPAPNPVPLRKRAAPKRSAAVAQHSTPPSSGSSAPRVKSTPAPTAGHKTKTRAYHFAKTVPVHAPASDPPETSAPKKESPPAEQPMAEQPTAERPKTKAPARRQAQQSEAARQKKEEALRLEEKRVEEARRKEELRRLQAQRQAETEIAQSVIDQAEAALKWAQKREAETYARELYDRARSSLGQALHALPQSPADAERWAVQARDTAVQAGRQAPINKAQIAINEAAAALKTAKDQDAERYAASRLIKARKALDDAQRELNSDPARALDDARLAKATAEEAVKVTLVIKANQAIHDAQAARIQARAVDAERYAASTYREGDDVLQQALLIVEADPAQAARLAQRALAQMQESIVLAKRRREEEERRRRGVLAERQVRQEAVASSPINASLKVDSATNAPSCHDKVYFELDGRSFGHFETPATIPLHGIVKGIHNYFVRVRRYCGERPPYDFIGHGKIDLSSARSFQLSMCGRNLCVQ